LVVFVGSSALRLRGADTPIWSLDVRFSNHLLAQQKLVERRREGSKVIKRYDAASTPVERAIASGVITAAKTASLRRITRRSAPATYREGSPHLRSS
jgi:hypothetical protein